MAGKIGALPTARATHASTEPVPVSAVPVGIANAANLKVGDHGFYCVCGEYYPARVVATGIRQSGGPVDEIIVYTKWGWRDVIARTTRGWCSFDNGSWIAAEHYEQVRAEHRERAIAEFDGKWPAQGMAARSDETAKQAQPEGQQPDPVGDAP